MEVQIKEEDGVKSETFTLIHNGLFLTVINQSRTICITEPRRKTVREESSTVMYNRVTLLKLNHHIRPGQLQIDELFWLTSSAQLQSFYLEDCMAHFTLYCREPVEFLTKDDNYFVHLMRDPWCYEQDNFQDCITDFARAYNRYHNSILPIEDLRLQVQHLEPDWNVAYHFKPEIEDLINSGFLTIKL